MLGSIIDKLASFPRIFIFLRKILENNFQGEKAVIIKYFFPRANEIILDIGCGTGEFSTLFPPKQYTGLDINKKYITFARDHYAGTFLIGDAASLPFFDRSFHKILIIGMLHHLPDATCRLVLQEVRRVLIDDGMVLVMEDLESADNSMLTKILHSFDKGKYVRSERQYRILVNPGFSILEEFKIKSGLCPYQVFLMNKK